jgi:homogentisate 1,2-dioxygenase
MAQTVDPRKAASSPKQAVQLNYMSGFGNHFVSEAEPGALPQGQNSPQKAPYGLYAEQLNGTAFSALRHENNRSWLYRIRPSVVQGKFRPISAGLVRSKPFTETPPTPNQLRCNPLPLPDEPTDFIQGLVTMCGNGGYGSFKGCAAHLYVANCAMKNRYFYNADGEFLLVPEMGAILLRTEFGTMHLRPGELAVIPPGVRYSVDVPDGTARGYVLENYGPALRLPYLSIIGSNGMANARDFLSPTASYEDVQGEFKLLTKYQGGLFEADYDHSPLDVVAWHGNYAPYKYDMANFNVINTVSFDHPDPSIFTVLTSPSEMPGIANVDFCIFPPRWLVAEHTFRPPYYHRNIMSEFMGLIFGSYDAKEDGFVPGGSSLHNCMSAHGPDTTSFDKASNAELKPVYLGDTLAFMFESSLVFNPTDFAMNGPTLQQNYLDCWSGLKAQFKPPQ